MEEPKDRRPSLPTVFPSKFRRSFGMAELYRRGGFGYGEVKSNFAAADEAFAAARERRGNWSPPQAE